MNPRFESLPRIFKSVSEALAQNGNGVLLLREPLTEEAIRSLKSFDDLVCMAIYSPEWEKFSMMPAYIHGWIFNPKDPKEFDLSFQQAKEKKRLLQELERLREGGSKISEKANQLLSAALELAEQKDFGRLAERTLLCIRNLTFAEGASLYLVNPIKHQLDLLHVQNEKVDLRSMRVSLPIDLNSLAGACAIRKKVVHTPDVRHMPRPSPFRFHSQVDEKSGYQTKDVLCFPLMKSDEELVGVVQVLNSKHPNGFTVDDMDIGKALSSYIAVTLEKMMLYQDIQKLFDGLVTASVSAIEARDPATAGHSERVALMTVALAESVSGSDHARFRKVKFSENDLRQIRYASLLHDFGKIAVPEKVLLKQKKLYPMELKEIYHRLKMLCLAYPNKKTQFKEAWKLIVKANEPKSVAEEVKLDELQHWVGQSFKVLDSKLSILTPEEWEKLKTRRGSLTPTDRQQMEQHVEHTFKFLSQIPWTKDLHRVPAIAYNHHERLDGSGYPRALRAESIPFESQIMAVADIYDALTAHDRPYKEKIPHDRALEILYDEGNRFRLDRDLIDLFVGQKIFELLSKPEKIRKS